MPIIGYNATTPFGARIATAIRELKDAQAQLARCIDMANDLTGGGATLTALESSTQFGVLAGQGANFYNALASLNSSLFANTSTRAPLQATIDLDQG
jgi:hypothetical protein